MADLQVLVSQSKLSKKDLDKALVTEYVKVCGEQGLETFQEKVLPKAFRYFGRDYLSLVREVLDIIEHAGDCKSSEIERYLKSVAFSGGRKSDTLEKSIKKLEGLLVVYNESRDS